MIFSLRQTRQSDDLNHNALAGQSHLYEQRNFTPSGLLVYIISRGDKSTNPTPPYPGSSMTSTTVKYEVQPSEFRQVVSKPFKSFLIDLLAPPLVPNLPEVVLRGQNIKMDGNIAYFADCEAVKDQ